MHKVKDSMSYLNFTKLAAVYARHTQNIFDSSDYDEKKTRARIQADKEQKQQYMSNMFNRVKTGLGFGSK